ncbi:HAD family hydrolase [Dermatophilaceae bacterium Soc4.6]
MTSPAPTDSAPHTVDGPDSRPGQPRALPAAVLWDMDGTLIDSEPYWIAEEHALVEAYGGTWSDEQAHALVGNPLEVSAQYILDHSPVTLTVAEVVDRLMRGVMARVEQEVPWRPGAPELLAACRAVGVSTALVTMSWRPFTDLLLQVLPADSFDVVVPGDAVVNGKPHPEPYLTALRELGLEAADCVAIEDSPAGVRSAAAAGVPTIAVPHVVPVPRIAGVVQLPTLAGLTPHDLLPLLDAAVRQG